MRKMRIAALAIAAMLSAGSAGAQGLGSIAQQNMAFDAAMNQRLMQMQQQNAAYGQQIWQTYLNQYGPWLQQEYRKHMASGGMPMSFEQFAYWNLMTANGTNIEGARQAQQNQFAGWQQANRTVQEGYASYNAGWAQNSARQSAAVDNYTRQAIQGNSPYADPNTGEVRWLPYSQPPGQVVNSGGTYYAQDQTGAYWQLQGNAWVRMGGPVR